MFMFLDHVERARMAETGPSSCCCGVYEADPLALFNLHLLLAPLARHQAHRSGTLRQGYSQSTQ